MFTLALNEWTSDLIISANRDIDEYKSDILSILNSIKQAYSKFKDSDKYDKLEITNESILKQYSIEVEDGLDMTCTLKGLAIDNIRSFFDSEGIGSYIISFGGDIYAKYAPQTIIPIEGTNFQILIDGTFSVFTSGNTGKRGHHIIGGDDDALNVVVYNWKLLPDYEANTLIDALATKSVADHRESLDLLDEYDVNYKYILRFKNGILTNGTYCASPFFNDKQIKVRDNMASKFSNLFRPDLQDNALIYDKDQSNKTELAKNVVEDNINGILKSEFLVFPNDTDDLGTLFEVGVQLSRGNIIKYNPNNDIYTVIYHRITNIITDKDLVFDCSNKSQVILMGRYSLSNMKLYYELKGHRDNIMLSVNYNHVEKSDENTYNLYKPKLVESNDNETEVIRQVNNLININQLNSNNHVLYTNIIYDFDIDVNNNVVTSVS